jgi:hypothetical protein
MKRLVSRPTNGYGKGASTPGRSRIGKTYGKLGILKGSDKQPGGADIGVRVRRK